MQQSVSSSIECVVLFADVVGSTQLYERIGDSAAFRQVDKCLKSVQKSIESKQGNVIKHTGDGFLAVFRSTNDAAEASVAIHNNLPFQQPGIRLSVKIGFQAGHVIQQHNDIFGETVNLAARLTELSTPGRVIISGETAELLGKEWKALLTPLTPRILRGASRPVSLFELKCDTMGDATVVREIPLDMLVDEPELKLVLNEQSLTLNKKFPIARVGRDSSADLRVSDTRASRRHAEIELRGDKFILNDRSSNGTYICIDTEKELFICREEFILHDKGHISLGGSCTDSLFLISFVCC